MKLRVDVSEMTPAQFRRYWVSSGFPWCDVCEKPAVWREGFGYQHSSAEHPHGIHSDLDDHAVSVKDWWNDYV